MREILPEQRPLTPQFPGHEHSRELQTISDILDEIPWVLGRVHQDLVRHCANPDKGRSGMSAEQALRARIIKQMNGFSYKQLAFHLQDSYSYQAFCRVWFGIMPEKSTLQENLKRISPETMEYVNRAVLEKAGLDGVEKGRKVRTDCTVVETNIHNPEDSEQLWDCVRVLTRLMGRGSEITGRRFSKHTKRAKRRAYGIHFARKRAQRRKLYRDLVKVTRETVADALEMAEVLGTCEPVDVLEMARAKAIRKELEKFIGMTQVVLNQTERRVLKEESVPAKDKLFSIFEPHTDIIKKGSQKPEYGHKICLTTGASSLILDCLILEGNPADSNLAKTAVDRQIDIYGRAPRQVAFDGSFASVANLEDIKGQGVEDIMFHKKCGLEISEMAKSTWVYRSLRNFRAGIEGGISYLKRCFGLNRCTWRGFESFKSYVWTSIVTANLLLLARHRMA